MARLSRLCLPGIPQHIIQRGNNRQACFSSQEDFAVYACWLNKYAEKYQVSIHAWVLMINHVHILATPESETGISKMMQSLGRRYVQYYNSRHNRTGTLWEGRFKSCLIDAEQYLLVCQRYIELNPVRAHMVAVPEDYHWSSYRANGLGQPARLWTPHPIYQQMGRTPAERANAYQALFQGYLGTCIINQIRVTTNQGMVLGNDRFKKEIERLSGRRVSSLKRGPKPKKQHRDGPEFLL